MRVPLAPLLAIVALAGSSAHAAQLALACFGTVATTHYTQTGASDGPQTENVADISVVVDTERKIVLGFWYDQNRTRHPLQIVAADAGTLVFKGDYLGASIHGSIDRVTAHVDAQESQIFANGAARVVDWDLRCKSTAPQF